MENGERSSDEPALGPDAVPARTRFSSRDWPGAASCSASLCLSSWRSSIGTADDRGERCTRPVHLASRGQVPIWVTSAVLAFVAGRWPQAHRVDTDRQPLGVAILWRPAAVSSAHRAPTPGRHTRAPRRCRVPPGVARSRDRRGDDPRPPRSDADSDRRRHAPGVRSPRPGEQQRRVAGWGRVLATACRSGRIARVQVSERTLPDSGTGLAEWWAQHGVG